MSRSPTINSTTPKSRMTYRSAAIFRQVLTYTLLLGFGLAFVLPFWWMLASSLKAPGAGMKFPPEFFPKVLIWSNYPKVFELIPLTTFFKNSLIITSFSLLGELFSASLVAFAFARLRFPGRNFLFGLVLATMMIPYPVTMVPTFILFKNLGMIETFFPLILPPWFGPAFSIFLIRQFFLTINTELDDAAKVDGASEFTIYWRILLPLSKPALATVAIFGFVFYWNDFLNPLIYLGDSEMFPLALGINFLRSFRSNGEIATQMAGSVMFIAPCILLYLLAQRYITEGIVTTGLKG